MCFFVYVRSRNSTNFCAVAINSVGDIQTMVTSIRCRLRADDSSRISEAYPSIITGPVATALRVSLANYGGGL
jgi:hypothetical protein